MYCILFSFAVVLFIYILRSFFCLYTFYHLYVETWPPPHTSSFRFSIEFPSWNTRWFILPEFEGFKLVLCTSEIRNIVLVSNTCVPASLQSRCMFSTVYNTIKIFFCLCLVGIEIGYWKSWNTKIIDKDKTGPFTKINQIIYDRWLQWP